MAKIKAEAAANMVGDFLFTDKNFINRLAKNQNVFQKVWNEIKYMMKMARAGSAEAKKLLEVQRTFEDAYRAAGKAEKSTADDGGVRYSLRNDIVDVNGKEYDTVVELDKAVSKSTLSNPKRFMGYIENNLVGLQIPVMDADGNIEIIEFAKPGETTSKGRNSHPVLGKLAYTKGDTRKQVIVNVQEVTEASVYDPVYSSKNNEHGWLDENGWESRKTYVLSQDGNIYEAYLRIAKTRDGRNILYAVNLNVENGIAVDRSATRNRAAVLAAMPSRETVAQENPNVKRSLSNEDAFPIRQGNYNVTGEEIAYEEMLPMDAAWERDGLDAEVAEEPVQEQMQSASPAAEQSQKETTASSYREVSPQELIRTVHDRVNAKREAVMSELENNRRLRAESWTDFNSEIAEAQAQYKAKSNKNTVVANDLLRRIERLNRLKQSEDAAYAKRISDLEARAEKMHSPEYERAEYRRERQDQYTRLWEDMIGNTATWKDMPLGLQYKTKTLRRILRKVVRGADGKADIPLADRIYDELETRYDHTPV